MSQEPIRYTHHARQRMKRRRITNGMVRQALEKPDKVGTGYLGRLLAWRAFSRGTLRVVYSEKPDALVIITTIWE